VSNHPLWQYDEMKQIGKDYSDLAEVEAYDARHGKFRNVEKENEDILAKLHIQPDQIVMEFGSGTGAFVLQAAGRCAHVYAVDVSQAMLEYSKKKAGQAGITNVTFCRGGFLTYSHTAQPVDAIVSNTAFHHLPDFWKGMALLRLNKMLKAGGLFYLSDVIFQHNCVHENIERWIEKLEKAAGQEIRKDVEAHIRQEFSTYDWILDGLLERANFEIISKTIHEGVIGHYLCRKR
jgi:cyclopropane fatty-acyl-phospholipid synthase-like methyltransferase